MVEMQVADEVGGLTTGCTVADGDGFDMIILHHLFHMNSGLHAVVYWWMGENGLVVQQIALCIETHHLAARAETRVDTHHALLAQRGGQQQLLQVVDEHVDGFLVGL